LIVKNEEKYLEKCLKSVIDIAGEIIVVDTGSTDRTKEIAANFTDKVFDFPWRDDFAAARNESIKYATKKWILCLDADEYLPAATQKQIIPLIKSYKSEKAIFDFKILDLSGTYQTTFFRNALFRNDPAIFFT